MQALIRSGRLDATTGQGLIDDAVAILETLICE